MADKTTAPRPPPPEMSAASKVGVAIAAAFSVIALFSLGLWVWWRRRQKHRMAKEMVNFVDGDIVNLVDGGRFEKPFHKPAGAYDPYYHGNSSSSVSTSPVYFKPPAHFTVPPEDPIIGPHHNQPASQHYEQPNTTPYNNYYAPFPASAPAASISPLPPSRDMPPAEPAHSIPPPLPAATATESHAWSNATRHPWSPPDYDMHSPISTSSVQAETAFLAAPRSTQPLTSGDDYDHYPVVALPAILPDPRPEPQAELPTRDIHGQGGESELPAPEQQPLRRHEEIDEQKFLLSDVLLLRQQKSKPSVRGNPPG